MELLLEDAFNGGGVDSRLEGFGGHGLSIRLKEWLNFVVTMGEGRRKQVIFITIAIL